MSTNLDKVTRIRAGGRKNTMPANPAERIAAFRGVVAEKSHAKIDGVMIDLFSASAVVAVYDGLSPENREKFAAMPAPKMALVAFKLLK